MGENVGGKDICYIATPKSRGMRGGKWTSRLDLRTEMRRRFPDQTSILFTKLSINTKKSRTNPIPSHPFIKLFSIFFLSDCFSMQRGDRES